MTYRQAIKQAIVVRNDIKMGKGKLATQVAHASVGSMMRASKKVVKEWEREGGKKVVLKVENLGELKALYEKAEKSKLLCFVVRDAGKTQLRPGTITCLGIGPDKEREIDKITKDLKLL